MTNTKHTPVPWIYRLASGNIIKTHIFNADRSLGIAHVFGDDKTQEDANARLIVHCVNIYDELLEALESIVKITPNSEDSNIVVLNKARAVIAKAKGERS